MLPGSTQAFRFNYDAAAACRLILLIRLEPIMLLNLPVMLFGNASNFPLLCFKFSLLCFKISLLCQVVAVFCMILNVYQT